jgi:hypothetical protein
MQYHHRMMLAALIIGGLQLVACQRQQDTHHVEHPVEITKIDGSNLSRVTLTERAIQRLDLKTDQVREQGGKKVVPYSSLIYDPEGQTWVYTSPQTRTFVRHKVDVDYIEGNLVVLNDGPPIGSCTAPSSRLDIRRHPRETLLCFVGSSEGA